VSVIRSFKNKGLQRFAEKGDASKLSVQKTAKLERLLAALDAATAPEQMKVPGLNFHALKGKMKGRYAVSVSGNWRLTFSFDGQDAAEIDLEDYH